MRNSATAAKRQAKPNHSHQPPRDALQCETCGAWFENLVIYSGCPNMHGKLHPRLGFAQQKYIASRQIKLTANLEKRGRYRIDGKPYRRIAKLKPRKAIKAMLDGRLVAVCPSIAEGFGEFEPIEETKTAAAAK